MTPELRETFRARAATTGFPLISLMAGSRVFEGSAGWDRLLDPARVLMPADVTDLETQLAAAEQRQQQIEAGRIPDRVPADPNLPDPYETEIAQIVAETNRAAEFRATVPGQLEELIRVNSAILAELQKR